MDPGLIVIDLLSLNVNVACMAQSVDRLRPPHPPNLLPVTRPTHTPPEFTIHVVSAYTENQLIAFNDVLDWAV